MLRISADYDEDASSDGWPTGKNRVLTIVNNIRDRSPQTTQSQRRGVGMWLIILGISIDLAIVMAAPFLVIHWTWWIGVKDLIVDDMTRALILSYALIATAMLSTTHRKGRRPVRASESLLSVGARLAIAPMLAFSLFIATNTDDPLGFDPRMWARLVIFTTFWVVLGRALTYTLTRKVRRRGYDLEDVLIVGAGVTGRTIATALFENPDAGLLPVGYVDRYNERLDLPLVGRPEDLGPIVEEMNVHHVILAFGAAPEAEIVNFVRACSHLPIQFYTVPRFFELGVSEAHGFEVDGLALIPLGRPGHHHLLWPFKRLFDLAVAIPLLVLTSPLFAAIAAAVKLTSPGPVLFRQERVSVDNIPFEILKFRTMRFVADPKKQAELDQVAQAVNLDDDRITSLGAFLRKTHLDELPQLINVVKGEMAIVGPRPERPYWVDQHSEDHHAYRYRHRVPAGITGWAQVNGFWGDTSVETRVRLDNRYIENWSPVRDLVIGLRTIPTLLGKRR